MADATTFSMPREQILSRRFLTVSSRPERIRASEGNSRRYFFFWARNGIYYGLKALGISSGAHILVPSYICKAAVEPIAAYGADLDFYRIGRDCQPDFSDLESRITPRTEAVLVVHYFGFPQRIQQLREFCDRHRLALIEDCAHVLKGEADGRPLGSFGDSSVFSWRKFLPLYDGGELLLNRAPQEIQVDWRGESVLFTFKVAKNMLDRLLESPRHPVQKVVSTGLKSVKRLRDSFRDQVGDQAAFLSVDSNSATFDGALLNLPMSRLSRWVFAHSDISAVIEKRRSNYLYLQERLLALEGITPLFPGLPSDVCPWVFPLFFDGLPNAHFELRRLGIPATTWGWVRPVQVTRDVFPDADFLYENLIFLPVHQNLKEESLELIVRAVHKIQETQSATRARCSVPKGYRAGGHPRDAPDLKG